MDKNGNDVNVFWFNFREAVIENGVSDRYTDWYVIYRIGLTVYGLRVIPHKFSPGRQPPFHPPQQPLLRRTGAKATSCRARPAPYGL